MDKLGKNPADFLDKTEEIQKAASSRKSPVIIPVTFLLDVTSILDAKSNISRNNGSHTSANDSINSENKDDITILFENTGKVNSCTEQNFKKKMLDDVAPKSECCSLLKPRGKKTNVPGSHNVTSKEIVIENELYCLTDSESSNENILENDISIIDEVTAKRERYNPKRKADVPEVIRDTVIVQRGHSIPDSKRMNKDISEDNDIIVDTLILNEMTFENECSNLSPNKNSIDNDVSILDEVTIVKQCQCNPQDSNSEGSDVTENSIKIVDVFSVDTKEYKLPSELRAKNKCLTSEAIKLEVDASATENDNGHASEDIAFLTEVPNSRMSLQEKRVLKEVNYSLLEKKEENAKNQSSCRKILIVSEHLNSHFKVHNSPLQIKTENKCQSSDEIIQDVSTTENDNEFTREEILFLGEIRNFHSSIKEIKISKEVASPVKKDESEGNKSSQRKNSIVSKQSISDFNFGYKCLWCSFATPTREVILKHLKEKHNDSEKVKCPFCYYKPVCRQYFDHVKGHLGNPPYLCSKCPYFTASTKHFISHVSCHAHTSPKKFSCGRCSFATDILLEFSEHQDVHPLESQGIPKREENFSCKVCYKMFHRKMHLLQHEKLHKERSVIPNYSFQCINCYFSTTREIALQRHQTVYHPETET